MRSVAVTLTLASSAEFATRAFGSGDTAPFSPPVQAAKTQSMRVAATQRIDMPSLRQV